MNGACTEGSHCPFSHNSKRSNPDMICRYYLQGSCSYGKGCRYDHVRPKQEEKARAPVVTKMPRPVVLPSQDKAVTLGGGSVEPQMVTLRKDPAKDPEQWIKAPEFVPGRSIGGAEVLGNKPSVGSRDNVLYGRSTCWAGG
eukprot:Em0016g915a